MNNEQRKAKELAELLNAFAEGRQLEWFNTSHWIEIPIACSLKNFLVDYNVGVPFRVKPETKRIALNQQDLIDRELRKETMRVKRNGSVHTNYFIDEICLGKVKLSDGTHIDYNCLAENYTWLDDTPCSKEVGCE